MEDPIKLQLIKEGEANLLSFASADGDGDRVANPDGRVLIVARNMSKGDRCAISITPARPTREIAGLGMMQKPPAVAELEPGGIAVLGPFNCECFNDPEACIRLEYDGVEGLEIAAMRLVI